jgi:hypothetical protein
MSLPQSQTRRWQMSQIGHMSDSMSQNMRQSMRQMRPDNIMLMVMLVMHPDGVCWASRCSWDLLAQLDPAARCILSMCSASCSGLLLTQLALACLPWMAQLAACCSGLKLALLASLAFRALVSPAVATQRS